MVKKTVRDFLFATPKAYSALEWLALALLQGPPVLISLEKALRLCKRPKHMNGCDM